MQRPGGLRRRGQSANRGAQTSRSLARFRSGSATKIYVLGVAVLLTLMVGVSRVYLGVHWPSDVLAGWCAGFAWAMLCWLVARRFFQRTGGSAAGRFT